MHTIIFLLPSEDISVIPGTYTPGEAEGAAEIVCCEDDVKVLEKSREVIVLRHLCKGKIEVLYSKGSLFTLRPYLDEHYPGWSYRISRV